MTLEIQNLNYKIKDLNSIQHINNVEKGNLFNETNMQNEEITRQQLIINKQEDIINELQTHLMQEMKEHEQDKNKLGTALSTLRSVNNTNGELAAAKSTFEDK